MKDKPQNPQLGTRINKDLVIEIKILAARSGRKLNDLVEEALKDLLKKHKVKI